MKNNKSEAMWGTKRQKVPKKRGKPGMESRALTVRALYELEGWHPKVISEFSGLSTKRIYEIVTYVNMPLLTPSPGDLPQLV